MADEGDMASAFFVVATEEGAPTVNGVRAEGGGGGGVEAELNEAASEEMTELSPGCMRVRRR
jgi:hypothetical protein